MGNSNSKRWLIKVRSDILANDLKGVTKQLIIEPRQEPEAHPFILVDEENPRGEDGELNWRVARSAKEERKDTEQKHQDWAGTAGEEKNLHYMETAVDKHGNKTFIVHPNAKPPKDEDLKKLYRNNGMWLSESLKTKVNEAHNECTASTFAIPKKNPAFLYPYCVNPKEDHFTNN